MKVTGSLLGQPARLGLGPHVHALLQRLEGRPAVDEGDDLAVEHGVAARPGSASSG